MAIACDRVRDLAPGFVLGALDRSEMAAVREHLATCTRPHPELGKLGGVVPYIGGSLVPIEPPARLRAAVLAAAKADLQARRVTPEPAHGAPVLTVVEDAPGGIVPFRRLARMRSRRAATWITRVAAAVAIVALVGTVLSLQGALDKAKEHDIWNDASTKGARSVALTAVGDAKGAGMAVLMSSGNLHVRVYNLEPTHGDQVYMAWVSTDGGVARNVGWFTVDDGGARDVYLNNLTVSSSVWVYVCREPNRNVTRPTGPVIVAGTIVMWPSPASTPTF